jgi:hypothetical protein
VLVQLLERDELGEEWLKPLRTDVAGGLSGHQQSLPELPTVAPSPHHRAADPNSSSSPEHRHGVLAVVPRGQAEGVQDRTPFPTASFQIPGRQFGCQLMPILDPHLVPRHAPSRPALVRNAADRTITPMVTFWVT